MTTVKTTAGKKDPLVGKIIIRWEDANHYSEDRERWDGVFLSIEADLGSGCYMAKISNRYTANAHMSVISLAEIAQRTNHVFTNLATARAWVKQHQP